MSARLFFLVIVVTTLGAFRGTIPGPQQPLDKLSDYQFFTGKLAELKPQSGVVPYSLNTPLFSNYAEKERFVKVPVGSTVSYNDSIALDFPIGTVLIKNFYYPNDFRKPEKGRRILETRLLVRTETEWEAWPYIWNDEQTEAYYDVAGDRKQVAYIDPAGKKVKLDYLIPNKNQCKGCHSHNGALVPLGPTARNLNGPYNYGEKTENQLAHWVSVGLLGDVPPVVPLLPRYDNSSELLTHRARAYLDVNCGNCHRALGPASSSGLFLDWSQQNVNRLGVNKSPVAAGRGSGGLPFDIVPGAPHHSILLYRMKTTDPGIAMPEIGRETVHKEGVELIESWIKSLKP